MRDFCKPIIMTEEQRKQSREEWAKLPKMEYWFDCRGDCLIYENGILIGIERKNGKYIDKR